MFAKILIANRGEIACHVIAAAKRMGIATVAVWSDADRNALHVAMADEAVHIGPAPAAQSYLVADRLIGAARTTGAEAVHPGYGFLSESAAFAEACEDAGLVFIGPPAVDIRAMGDKMTSKRLAAEAGVSTVPGVDGALAEVADALAAAESIGYPVMIKASAGGGGKGMRIARNEAELREGYARARSEAASSFGDDRVFVEKYIVNPRHIEVQVLADNHGNCIHLGERECSIQRRHQKIIEESPSPFVDEDMRQAMGGQAVALAKAVGYRNAGTVEFVVDADHNFYFLEMNTRLQVEYPVTELVTGVDMIEQMVRIAAGEKLAIAQDDVKLNGWAIEGRVYAEDPRRGFLPSPGRLSRYRAPTVPPSETAIVRNDAGVVEGASVTPHYDPLIAKLSAWAPDRPGAIEALDTALDEFELEGIAHNIPFLQAVLGQERFRAGRLSTAYLDEEFPDGFSGAPLEGDRRALLIGLAAVLHRISASRVGVDDTGGGHWSVFLDDDRYDVALQRGDDGSWTVGGDIDERRYRVDWRPGATLAFADTEDFGLAAVKVDPVVAGFRLRHRGADRTFRVLAPHVADLSVHMARRERNNRSSHLVSPMPGQIVRLEVADGDRVEPGQPLVIVEAMKMENILRAERAAVVARVVSGEGAVVAVDQVILEFDEAPES